ncbi:hypothetical protein E4U55_004303 [Claviceps digitariae]|nr:hypothetical protein E4U55_004303 [Claviceps digitariae]
MFVPPAGDVTPNVLFPPSLILRAAFQAHRYIHRDDVRKILIYTDGACLNNGQVGSKAGWAFVFIPFKDEGISARLENNGPFGDRHDQTSNRAELRAVIAALRFRHWVGEGFDTIVLATDSEYVAKGATEYARTWVHNGWRRSNEDKVVKNQDLWKALLGEIERWDSEGLKVQFWRIPRALNVMADRAAKCAALEEPDVDGFADVMGVAM